MASRRTGPAAARRLVLLLLAVTVLLSALLTWFGVRLLDQDRELVAQRDFERRQAAAQSIVAGVERALADAERKLAADGVPAGTIRLQLTSRTASAEPRDAAAWLPIAPALSRRAACSSPGKPGDRDRHELPRADAGARGG